MKWSQTLSDHFIFYINLNDMASPRVYSFPNETKPEDIVAEVIKSFCASNSNVGAFQTCYLKEGPKIWKFAIIYQILNASTREHHHLALNLVSFRRYKDGWVNQDEKKIELDDDGTDEIGILEKFIEDFRQVNGITPGSYDVVRREPVDGSRIPQITDFLENAGNYQLLVQNGGLQLAKDIISWICKEQNATEIVSALQGLDIDSLKEISAIAGIAQLNAVLNVWVNNANNSDEEYWQRFLKQNSWVISQVFSAPVIVHNQKAYVGGKKVSNTGGNLADYLFTNKLTHNIAIVEIKTPCTQLLRGPYRETYSMSDELSGATNQLLNYKHHIQRHFISLRDSDNEEPYEVFNPQTLLIAGRLKDYTEDVVQVRAIELYRSNLKDVCIITFDELFEKVRIIKSLLETGMANQTDKT